MCDYNIFHDPSTNWTSTNAFLEQDAGVIRGGLVSVIEREIRLVPKILYVVKFRFSSNVAETSIRLDVTHQKSRKKSEVFVAHQAGESYHASFSFSVGDKVGTLEDIVRDRETLAPLNAVISFRSHMGKGLTRIEFVSLTPVVSYVSEKHSVFALDTEGVMSYVSCDLLTAATHRVYNLIVADFEPFTEVARIDGWGAFPDTGSCVAHPSQDSEGDDSVPKCAIISDSFKILLVATPSLDDAIMVPTIRTECWTHHKVRE